LEVQYPDVGDFNLAIVQGCKW